MDAIEEIGEFEARCSEVTNAVAGKVKFKSDSLLVVQDLRIARLKNKFHIQDSDLIEIFMQIELIMKEKANG